MAREILEPGAPEPRRERDRKDLETINANSKELNDEAEDVLGCQVDLRVD